MESNTVSQHILKYVEEMFIETEKENEEFKKIQLSKRLTEVWIRVSTYVHFTILFLKQKFKENLAIAINEAYFGQVHEESPKNGVEPDKGNRQFVYKNIPCLKSLILWTTSSRSIWIRKCHSRDR